MNNAPIIHADRGATFRVDAPTASTVEVAPWGGDNGMGKGPFPMVKGADGAWTVTIPPARAGFHYYHLNIDGVNVADPASLPYYGWGRFTSAVDVPEAGVDFYDAKD